MKYVSLFKCFCLVVFCIIFFALNSFGQMVVSEILNLNAETDVLLIKVAKKYPQINSSEFQNPNKILIELPNSTYHKTFVYDEKIKKNLLNGFSFVDDISVGVAKYKNDSTKVGIILTLKQNVQLKPKVVSTKDSIVRISFVSPENKQAIIPAVQLEENIVEKKKEKTINLYNTAVEEHTKGNLAQAEMTYNEVLSNNDEFYLAKFNLAKIYIDNKNYDKAINILLDSIQKLSSNPETVSNVNLFSNSLGVAYYLQGSYDEALKQFQEILKRDSNFYQAYYNIGLICEKTKDLEKAKLNFEKELELTVPMLREDLANAYYHLSVLNLLTKDKKKALSGFKKVVELVPDSKIAKLSQSELEKLEARLKFLETSDIVLIHAFVPTEQYDET